MSVFQSLIYNSNVWSVRYVLKIVIVRCIVMEAIHLNGTMSKGLTVIVSHK